MIGFEYICNLFNTQYIEVAELLDISKQTINSWTSKRRKIPEKYLPILEEKFKIPQEYFQKEVDEIDKLVIQKEKLKEELKPEIVGYSTQLIIDDECELVQAPIYNSEIIKEIEVEINKTKVINDFREFVSCASEQDLMILDQFNVLLKKNSYKDIFIFTLDALAHYYSVLPDWVGEPESLQFVEEFIELARKYD